MRYVEPRTLNGVAYTVQRYRPRIEGLFARIERWTSISDRRDVTGVDLPRQRHDAVRQDATDEPHRRSGRPEPHLQLADLRELRRQGQRDRSTSTSRKTRRRRSIARRPHERNRTPCAPIGEPLPEAHPVRQPRRRRRAATTDLAARDDWLFEVVFDYGEHYTRSADGQPASVQLDDHGRTWARRQDPFSTYRAGFEVRTYRLCQRVLMFHHFPDELGVGRLPGALAPSSRTRDTAPIALASSRSVTQSGYVRRRRRDAI